MNLKKGERLRYAFDYLTSNQNITRQTKMKSEDLKRPFWKSNKVKILVLEQTNIGYNQFYAMKIKYDIWHLHNVVR